MLFLEISCNLDTCAFPLDDYFIIIWLQWIFFLAQLHPQVPQASFVAVSWNLPSQFPACSCDLLIAWGATEPLAWSSISPEGGLNRGTCLLRRQLSVFHDLLSFWALSWDVFCCIHSASKPQQADALRGRWFSFSCCSPQESVLSEAW